MERDLASYWNKIYNRSEVDKLGWYEESPEPSLSLIAKCNLSSKAAILNVGAGATTLVDELLEMGYENVIASDFSTIALEQLKKRLGDKEKKVKWIVDDLTNPFALNQIDKVDLWHDRAVLHFFNEQKERDAYFDLLKSLVKKEGYVIIATFNLEGATKCSGLPVYRYNKDMLKAYLGIDYELIEAFDYVYRMPSGDLRNYVYTLFKRIK